MADNELNRAAAAIPIEAANSVIQQIFAVSLTLASCPHMVNGPVAERLATAINDLDAIIAGLRKAAWEKVEQHTNTPADQGRRRAVTADTTALTYRLGVVARWTDQLSRSAASDGADLIHLLDATHSVYRAVVTLAGQPCHYHPTNLYQTVQRPNPRNRRAAQPPSATTQETKREIDMPAKRGTKPKTTQVTFTLPASVDAQEVALCGEFNDWSANAVKLSRNHDQHWQTTLDLEPGRSYRYRYLLDGHRWENAWDADQYAPNPYGSDDSVIVVPA